MFDLLHFALYVVRHIYPAKKMLKQRAARLDKHAHKRMFSLALFAVAGSYPYVVCRGKSLRKNERQSLILLGAATALCDDLTDEHQYPLEALKNLFANDVVHNPENATESVCRALYKEAMAIHPNPELFLNKLFTALEAQEQSKRQLGKTLDFEKLWQITQDKGGTTNVLFLHFLHHLPNKSEEAFAHQAGIALQLLDDLFDLYEDLEDGVHTPVTAIESLDQLEALYTAEAREAMVLLGQISPSKRSESAVGFIYARGTIALDQYRTFCRESHQSFPPKQYRRKDLIIDMEKGANLRTNVVRRFVFSRPKDTSI